MKKKLFIHIGTEKTGTTALQATLHTNREMLFENSINYPELGFYKQAQFSLVSSLIKEQTGNDFEVAPKGYISSKEDEWGELIDNILRNKSNVNVISAEHFSSRLNEKSVEWIGGFLKDKLANDFDIIIVVYLRRQDFFLESSFNTAIKTGDRRTFQQFKEAEKRNIYRYDYSKMLSPWINTFGKNNVVVKVFEKNNLLNQNIVEDFLDTIDVKIDFELKKANQMVNENHSWHPNTIRLARFINSNDNLKSILDSKKLNTIYKVDKILKNIYPLKGAMRYQKQSEAVEFIKLFEAGNAIISDEFFNGTSLFSSVNISDESVINFERIELYDSLRIIIELITKNENI